ncbi:MAG: RluA family pseudouridine synthase [Candidatus Firestonebacteria bacterium]|nr:RluA family pseudouridine synthase [Candidatus Firestonebacteria bacterium]
MEIKIHYEDNHILVVDKPVNIPVQEDKSKDKDLLNILKEYIKQKYNKPGNVFLTLVHRLDRPVGGLMVFAKTSKATSRLFEQFRLKSVNKTYLAVVRGVLPKSKDNLKHYILKDKDKNIVKIVSPYHSQGKEALLYYESIQTVNNLSLIKIDLKTGKPHQIRVQIASLGTPIFGDQKYGININKQGEQLALWSYKLSFVHPINKETLTFISIPKKQYPWDLFNLIMPNLI